MNTRNDFYSFAKSKGVSAALLNDKKIEAYFNPNVIEERSNISSMVTIDIYSRLLIDRQLFLGGEITDELCDVLIAQLLWLEQQGDQDVHLLINSPGGSVSAGMAIIDVMDYIKCNVNTTIVGTAASMASVIACNGQKGKRKMLPHSKFMIHQPMQNGGGGKCDDILINAEQIRICRDELYEVLSKNSNLSVDEIKNMASNDCWLRSDDAIKYGFVDKIVTNDR